MWVRAIYIHTYIYMYVHVCAYTRACAHICVHRTQRTADSELPLPPSFHHVVLVFELRPSDLVISILDLNPLLRS